MRAETSWRLLDEGYAGRGRTGTLGGGAWLLGKCVESRSNDGRWMDKIGPVLYAIDATPTSFMKRVLLTG